MTERTEWGEVGVTDAGKVYVLVGTSRIELTAYADFSSEELKQLKEEKTVAISKTDPIGWKLRAEVTAEGGIARGEAAGSCACSRHLSSVLVCGGSVYACVRESG